MRCAALSLTLALLAASPAAASPPPAADAAANSPAIVWEPWSDAVFARAEKEKRLVLLDLEAVWCHWCHVMAAVTYKDPKVVELIASRYIAVRVDQDSRPDLASRYEDYGWPATIIFKWDGSELAKRRGYLAPPVMASLLKAFIDSPTPGPSITPEEELAYPATALLPAPLREELLKAHRDTFHEDIGAWGGSKKFLDWDSTEYALSVARRLDASAAEAKAAAAMASLTLRMEKKLIDPVWGGVYQYSAGGTWDEPHYEKIMQFQAETMRAYALAILQLPKAAADDGYPAAIAAIRRYLNGFLRDPGGAFYVSQDADLVKGEHSEGYFKLDDAARRKRGVPRVDTSIYARENGWAIHALAHVYAALGDESALAEARAAAAWIETHRSLPGGGFRHGEKDAAGPFLGDTLAMGRAYLALHMVTGERALLAKAEQAAAFIAQGFAHGAPGYLTAKSGVSERHAAKPNREDNILVARFANLLHHYTGAPEHRAMAESALRFLAAPAIARRWLPGGVLLAAAELAEDPVHITVVGGKGDAAAKALFQAALRYPSGYKRIEWWDRSEGPARRGTIKYPELPVAAAFACTKDSCSLPIRRPEELLAKVEKLRRPAARGP